MTIFADPVASVGEFRARYAATEILESALGQLSDEILYKQLLSAEKNVSRRLRILLEPTTVVCSDDLTQEMQVELDAADMPWIEEAGYDYSSDFFIGDGWGLLQSQHKPIISIDRYRMVYGPFQPIMTIPPGWIRLDKRYGHVRLVPVGEAASLPLGIYQLNIFGGGRTVPQMIRLDYTAGIADLADREPELYGFIFRVAALLLIRDAFPAGTGSISVDGLSESRGFDIKAYVASEGGAVEAEYRSWMDYFHGVRLGVA